MTKEQYSKNWFNGQSFIINTFCLLPSLVIILGGISLLIENNNFRLTDSSTIIVNPIESLISWFKDTSEPKNSLSSVTSTSSEQLVYKASLLNKLILPIITDYEESGLGIGIGIDNIKPGFEAIGFTFNQVENIHNKINFIGLNTGDTVLINILGNVNNITQASIATKIPYKYSHESQSALLLGLFIRVVSPEWENGMAWINYGLKELSENQKNLLITEQKNYQIHLRVDREVDLVILTIKSRSKS
ncbi:MULTISPECIES: hypothetical protein [unclassified Moorena]|uniref:hypothetical protein n=2 Tax=Moorena TaxID=1155738 RepID=UPI0013B6D64E|nr:MULTISPECIES: hypothetical protein [unclassified Moorena]NEQ11533.1 hypothetical protein [Moorena sp. SIO4E2]NER90217.1 hypothetical protein [Moorena sp. SIO3A2]NET65499.1 hypothetical protein [Moorena sp. SIO1G6]